MTISIQDPVTVIDGPSRLAEPGDAPGDTGHRIVTGDRPTGPLHIGHFLGTLANRVRLQETGCPVTVVIADYQVITDRDSTGPLRDRVRMLIAEYLAAGIDPDRSVIFAHSLVRSCSPIRCIRRPISSASTALSCRWERISCRTSNSPG